MGARAIHSSCSLLAGDTLVRGSEQRLQNRGATPLQHRGSAVTASAHKPTRPKGIKAESGIEEGLFSPLCSGREGSPNLQCEMQHLITMLNVLAPNLAIFKEST